MFAHVCLQLNHLQKVANIVEHQFLGVQGLPD